MKRWLPGLQILARYEANWLPHDLMAGLVLTTMLVPVGIAYAVASGLPGIHGLYATIVPLLAYALFGPSRILVLGPDSALAAVILAVVVPISGGDPARAVAAAGLMAMVSGLVCLLVGVLRLGFVTELLSKPIRYGYMNGIALTVLIGQLPKLFGFKIDGAGPLRDLASITSTVAGGQVNWTAFAVGAGTLAVIFLLKPFKRVPGLLLAVVGATIAVGVFDLDQALSVLGPLPQGLPTFAVPWISAADLSQIVIGGCAVAMVAFADTSVLSRTYAARTRTPVDPNQEMIGLGAANLAAGLFQGFAISSSSSRTPVAEAAGARTQLTGVTGAIAVALLLVFAPNLLQYLPNSALAAVVIAAAVGLFEFADLRRIFRIQQWEFWLSVVCFAGVATFGVIPGIGIAIVLAVIEFLWDGWRPHHAVLGRVDGVRGYHDIKRYPDARRIPGLVLFRWDAPLFFANAELFNQRVLEAVAEVPDAGPPDYRRRRAGHQHRRHVGRCARRAEAHAARLQYRASVCRDEGSGQGQAEAVRDVRGLRGFEFPSHGRRCGRRLSRRARRRLEAMRNGDDTTSHWRLGWPTAAGLAVVLGGPEVIAALSSRVAGNNDNLGIQIFLQLIFCSLAVVIVAIVIWGEHLPLSSIGLRRPDWSTLTTALLLFLVGFFVLPLVTNPLVEAWGRQGAEAGIAELAKFPAWFRAVLAVTGGVVEETLYRGYAVERLSTLTGRRWLGATLATLVFAAAHIPAWGLGFALAADLPAGVLLVGFYLWRRDLIANMLAHSAGILVAMFTVVPPVT